MTAKRIMVIALLVLVAVLSFTKVSSWAADPANHTHSIEQTEEKISSVMKLSAGAAATSATLSLLPGDMCTPIAQELAELSKYFLLILSALYLEKFLISLSGYITFMFLIPLACAFVCGAVITGKKTHSRTAAKIALVGAIIFLIVPASVKLSDMVYRTQASKVNETIEEYNDLQIEGDSESGLFSEFKSITTETVDRITKFLDDMLETLAVMVVTACVIPMLVFVFLVWLVKVIFSANILTLDTEALDAITEKLR